MLNPFAQAGFLISCAQLTQLPEDAQPEIAFAGRSNAGKSSAMNLLCAQKQLARVSKTPGRTQLLNLFGVPGGRFVDLPGYGYAAVPKGVRLDWGKLVGSYLEGRQNLVGIVLIMDIRHPLTDYDRQMLGWAAHRGMPCHCLLTKADKLGFGASKTQLLQVRRELATIAEGASVQLFSSETRQGLEEAQTVLMGWLGITAETTFANWTPPAA
ncbi:MAG TPA: ribosome biogenesis GTP-binding protein YihA/YsxC [Solimonas sp.]|nr:ribosome biogenesis GTP-binding protein YihA/YsxC [Solimonas sp.]